ncbi:ABC transporter substrate-binding protein [Ruoffia tabacinasalis]|jgi:branched-chain amino acid transport system substrate-binding protein|uniref:ABC transporter substrate-binding protein n=1 Tax=Ruoffia tabacinasalis TaxID=87458 RepID=A0ABS0LH69_9LACT|nr:ABC transporter substrate-binding protein [Ruoffia tabacinasalis]MBG9977449.1 ABC transporter substrate-binding protein [Ruoffia tabacinasalis]
MDIKIKQIGKHIITGITIASALLSPVLTSAQDTVKIGANYELSGDAASYGTQMLEGLELAVEEVNANGGVLDGQEIEIVSYDNQSDVTESASVAQRLVAEGVVGVVGPATTGNTEAQLPIFTEANIPMVSPSATDDNITFDSAGDVLEYFFRVCFNNSYQGSAGAAFAAEDLSATNALVFVDQSSDYSRGLADNFNAEFESRGGTIVNEDSFTAGDTDFSAILTTAMTQDFDVIYIPAYYTEAGLIIKQAREMGIEQPIIGPDGFSSEVLLDLAGVENANDIYYTDHFSNESEEESVQNFLSAFEEKYGKEGGTWNALGYDAAMLIIDAIERSGSTDPQAITDAIAETTEFAGVTGTFAIDEDHNPVKPAVMIELQEGEIVSAENVSAE